MRRWMAGMAVWALALGAAAEDGPGNGSLGEELAARQAEFEQNMPPEMVALFQKGIDEVGTSGILEQALKVGDTAPEFTLPDALGNPVESAALLAKGPVVLTFYRGGWCPYCNIQLRALQRLLPDFEAASASLVAVSPDLPDLSLDTAQKEQLTFTVLSDAGNRVARKFGLLYPLPEYIVEVFQQRMDLPGRTGGGAWELPLAATYVIDTDGIIRYAFLDKDYRKRAEPAEVLAAVASLNAAAAP